MTGDDVILILNRQRKWAAVEVPRCGCTTLKIQAAGDAFPEMDFSADEDEVHWWLGWNPAEHPEMLANRGGAPRGFVRFAVWRDPVERCLSTWRRFCWMDYEYQPFIDAGLRECEIEKYVAWLTREFQTHGDDVDAHTRRQVAFYTPAEVRHVVKLDDLTAFLGTFGHGEVIAQKTPKIKEKAKTKAAPKTSAPATPTPAILAEIACLYAEDYSIPHWGKTWQPS